MASLWRTGTEATEGYEDVGHSQDAREMLADMLVGELPEDEAKTVAAKVYTPHVGFLSEVKK